MKKKNEKKEKKKRKRKTEIKTEKIKEEKTERLLEISNITFHFYLLICFTYFFFYLFI